jgi:predicted HicB family RNase H-like nuclease
MTTDNRVTIKIDLEEDVLYQLMLRAHEQDITLNQMIERILREYIDEYEKSKV